MKYLFSNILLVKLKSNIKIKLKHILMTLKQRYNADQNLYQLTNMD